MHAMELFYAEKITDQTAHFSPDECRHIVKTYRKREGESLHFTLGDGYLYDGIIQSFDKKGLTAFVSTKNEWQKPWKGRLHMAIAPTKNFNRIEWMVERMVELGLDELTPLFSQRSERVKWKSDRLERLVLAACKQSLKCTLPIIHEPRTFETFCAEVKDDNEYYLGHCESGEKMSLSHIELYDRNVCFCVGPEGDFTPNEISLALKTGFQGLSLGQQRLRTETAAMKMATAFHIYNDWE